MELIKTLGMEDLLKDASYKYNQPIPQQIVPSDWGWSGLALNQAYTTPPHNSPAPQPHLIHIIVHMSILISLLVMEHNKHLLMMILIVLILKMLVLYHLRFIKFLCPYTDTAFTCYGDSSATAYVCHQQVEKHLTL